MTKEMPLYEKKHFRNGFPVNVRCVLCKKKKPFKSFFKVSKDCTGMDKKKPFLENFIYGPPVGLCLSCANGEKVYLLNKQSNSVGIFKTSELAFQTMEREIKTYVETHIKKYSFGQDERDDVEDYQRLCYTVQPVLVNQPLAVIPNSDSFLSAEQKALLFPTVPHPIAVYRCLGCGQVQREDGITIYDTEDYTVWFCKDSDDCEESAKRRHPPQKAFECSGTIKKQQS